MKNLWMVYDRKMLNGSKRTMVEPYNQLKIEHFETVYGMDAITNLQLTTEKEARKEWEQRTGGESVGSPYDNTKEHRLQSKKVPKNLRKAGNIHKLMDWKHKNNIA